MMFSWRSSRLCRLWIVVFLLAASAAGQSPVGEVFASDATVKGSVVLAGGGTRVMSGSSVTAGEATATMKLLRGGEVRVCRGSSVSVTSSPTGREIMFSLNSGTIETRYSLPNSTDTVMTPDFQISLAGPGAFHFAISADERGNTCIQALPSNTGSVIISELMGDGSYKLKPDEQLFFRAGHASNPGKVTANCGCPAPLPVLRAQTAPPKPKAEPEAAPPATTPLLAVPAASQAELTSPPPTEKPGEIHVQVDAPFVFRASEPVPEAAIVVAQVELSPLPVLPDPVVLPPAPKAAAAPEAQPEIQPKPKKPKKKGFWARLASLFGG